MEQPQYILQPNVKRTIVPQIFLMILLGILFFLGIRFNAQFLGLEIPPYFIYVAAGLIIGILLINLMLIYKNILKENYRFYLDRLEHEGKKSSTIQFSQVLAISVKRNFLDRIFNTSTILIEPGFKIKNIENSNQIYFYIQRLIQYYKGGYKQ